MRGRSVLNDANGLPLAHIWNDLSFKCGYCVEPQHDNPDLLVSGEWISRETADARSLGGICPPSANERSTNGCVRPVPLPRSGEGYAEGRVDQR